MSGHILCTLNFHVLKFKIKKGPKRICLFVFGVSFMSGQLIIELFPDCLKVILSTLVLSRRVTTSMR